MINIFGGNNEKRGIFGFRVSVEKQSNLGEDREGIIFNIKNVNVRDNLLAFDTKFCLK